MSTKQKTLTLAAILQKFEITQTDLILVGDGSGTGWKMAAGWACVLIEQASYARHLVYGAASNGTVNLAELWPYYQAMLWYIHGPWHPKDFTRRRNVHILTDSRTIAQQGNGHANRKLYSGMWAEFDSWEKTRNMRFHFRWVERDQFGLNRLVDDISRKSRIAMESVKLPDGKTLYDYSPE